jgi:hypothetical protein
MGTNTVTTGQQSIPEELMPYFTGVGTPDSYGILPKAQEIFTRSYANAYGNPLAAAGLEGAGRISGLSEQEITAGQQLAAMQQPSQFAAGSGAYAQGLGSLGQAANAFGNIGQVSGPGLSQFQMQAPQNVSAQGLNTYQMAGPQQFTGENVGQYMSPYAQQVMDVQKQEALRDFGKGLSAQNLGAARQGTYGGARNILANTEMQRNLQTQLGGIQASGMQNAFQNAQQQFNTSQAQQQAAQQANLQAALGVQQFGAGQSLEAQRANQAAQQAAGQTNLQALLGVQQLGAGQSLEAQRANQAAQLQAAQGYGQLGQMYGALGQGLGQQGALQQQTDLARATALGAYGGTRRSFAQQQLDAQYQDQMRALSFPEQQLGSFANILRGVPLGDTVGTQATTTPPPSFASQLAGVGLGGLSLFNMLGKPG